jgi:hypothetical protein
MSVARRWCILQASGLKSEDMPNGLGRLQESDVNKLAIPDGAMIFVGHGRKALILRNNGDGKFPNLKTKRVFAEQNPSSHEQGTDRPGVTFAHAGSHRHVSMGDTD